MPETKRHRTFLSPTTLLPLHFAIMSLPKTTAEDLRHMGITPEAIKAELELRNYKIEGKIVSILCSCWYSNANACPL